MSNRGLFNQSCFICRWLTSYPPVRSSEQLNRLSPVDHTLPPQAPVPVLCSSLASSLSLSRHVTSSGKCLLRLASGLGRPSVGSHGSLQFPTVVSCCPFSVSAPNSLTGEMFDCVCPEAGPGPGWAL